MSTIYVENGEKPGSAPGRRRRLVAAAAIVGLVATACGDGDGDNSTARGGNGGENTTVEADDAGVRPDASDGDTGGSGTSVRLGMFPNVTHAPGLVAYHEGLIEERLGAEVTVYFYNAGGEAAQALLAGQIDMTYIGPNPAINAYAQSDGDAVRVVAGSTSGGAFLITRDGVDQPDDLRGTRIATPSPVGNTQDVAFKSWLAEQGYGIGGGDDQVEVVSMGNADVLQAFRQGDLDGAWTVEPWTTRLLQEADGQVLVDERDLWPDGQYVTTHILSSTAFLEDHPDAVAEVLDAHLEALRFIDDDPAASQQITVDVIAEETGAELDDSIVAASWENLEFTSDPIANSLQGSADDAVTAGLLDPVDLEDPGIYDLAILNTILADRGEEEVPGP